MTQAEKTAPASVSLSLLQRAIKVCDQFEADWRRQAPRPIEEYLSEASAEDRAAVLYRLIGLEIELRRTRGEEPTPQDYLSRFPDQHTLVESAFRELVMARSLPAECPAPWWPSEASAADAGTDTVSASPAPEDPRDDHGADGVPASSRAQRVFPGGRYTLDRIHAQGGIGQVWLAYDHHLGREIALKRLRPLTSLSPVAQARFLREARVTGRLHHPGIAPVYELEPGGDGKAPFYTMRFISGRTLTESAREYHRQRTGGTEPSIQLRELLGAFQSVCQVIAYAHSRGVIHRDIKGQNVVLGDFGEVVVLDWGLARIVEQAQESPAEHDHTAAEPQDSPVAAVQRFPDASADTVPGELLGTPCYMSPEQALGRTDLVDERSDIYGLGAILYEILTGEPPFRGSVNEVLRQVVEELPQPPRKLVREVPPALEAVCLKCLAKTPQDRYIHAADLADDVRRYLADEPVSAYPEHWTARARRWTSRHRTLATACLASLLVATMVLSAATVFLKLSAIRETAAHERARNNLQLAMAAVDQLYGTIVDDPALKSRGLERKRQELLQLGKDFYDIFARQENHEPRVETERGRFCVRLARFNQELGQPGAAVPLSQQACSIFEQLAQSYPAHLEYRGELARALDCLGSNYKALSQPAEARAAYQRAIDLLKGILREHEHVPKHRLQAATTLNHLARLLGLVLRDPGASEQVLGESLRQCRYLLESSPEDPVYLNEQAEALLLRGAVQGFSGDLTQAEQLFDQVLKVREKLAVEHGTDIEYQASLVDSCMLIAAVYSNARKSGKVPVLHTKIRQISERLRASTPTWLSSWRIVA